ncbi:unnamed protein product [Paramecium primaurelia]|uniref:CID domain-containing protein n=1 Tax=Paramecium primaurelia TaxID=5886 RepID=A0A8S1MWE3_PARPR|nr:unnamed protein product [Paramecium primaurelia]
MIIKQIEKLLSSINENYSTIQSIAQFCFENPDEANFIAFLVENEIKQVESDRKLLYLFLIHEIFLLELKQRRATIDFIKAFGMKMKNMIQVFQIVSSIQLLDKVFYLINKWETEMIFHPNFTMKLRSILLPKYELLQKSKQQQLLDEMEKSEKLEKNLKIIQSVSHPKQCYKLLKQVQQLEKRTLEFNQNRNNVNKMKYLNLMIEEGEECRKLLINSICQIQQFYLDLSKQGEELMKDLKSTNKLDYYKRKKKKLFR